MEQIDCDENRKGVKRRRSSVSSPVHTQPSIATFVGKNWKSTSQNATIVSNKILVMVLTQESAVFFRWTASLQEFDATAGSCLYNSRTESIFNDTSARCNAIWSSENSAGNSVSETPRICVYFGYLEIARRSQLHRLTWVLHRRKFYVGFEKVWVLRLEVFWYIEEQSVVKVYVWM